MLQFLGGLGALTPGILGVGAAGTLGGAAVVNQIMDQCPASRPCRVSSIFSHCILPSPGEGPKESIEKEML